MLNIFKRTLFFLLAFPAITALPQTPTNLGSMVNSSARDAEPTFTADGQTMYFNCFDREGEEGSDICVSHLEGEDWASPQLSGR